MLPTRFLSRALAPDTDSQRASSISTTPLGKTSWSTTMIGLSRKMSSPCVKVQETLITKESHTISVEMHPWWRSLEYVPILRKDVSMLIKTEHHTIPVKPTPCPQPWSDYLDTVISAYERIRIELIQTPWNCYESMLSFFSISSGDAYWFTFMIGLSRKTNFSWLQGQLLASAHVLYHFTVPITCACLI